MPAAAAELGGRHMATIIPEQLLVPRSWFLQELCLPECFFKASLMVMKFFSDLDILQPAIVRWPVCKKYLTQQSFSK